MNKRQMVAVLRLAGKRQRAGNLAVGRSCRNTLRQRRRDHRHHHYNNQHH